MRRYPITRHALRPAHNAPPVQRIDTDGLGSGSYDVVVIGAGVFGLSTAYALAKGGARVAVVEKGIVGGEASGRAVGFLESVTLDPMKADAAAVALRFWRQISAAAGDGIGLGTGLAFYAGQGDTKRLAGWQAWCAKMGHSHPARVVGEAQARAMTPEISAAFPIMGAVWSPQDLFVEPRLALPALAQLAQAAGADVAEGVAVRRVVVEAGHVRGVATTQGVIRARHVVLAAGVWNSIFARHLGIALPQLYGFATAVELVAPQGGLPCHAGAINGSSFRPTPWGSHVGGPQLSVAPLTPLHLRQAWAFRHAAGALAPVMDIGLSWRHFSQIARALRWNGQGRSPFEDCPVLATAPREFARHAAKARLSQAFGVADLQERGAWAGAIACSPDNLPILDSPKILNGLHIGAGMYFGLTFGPAMGLHLACQILGQPLPFDAGRFRLSRFDGPIRHGFTA